MRACVVARCSKPQAHGSLYCSSHSFTSRHHDAESGSEDMEHGFYEEERERLVQAVIDQEATMDHLLHMIATLREASEEARAGLIEEEIERRAELATLIDEEKLVEEEIATRAYAEERREAERDRHNVLEELTEEERKVMEDIQARASVAEIEEENEERRIEMEIAAKTKEAALTEAFEERVSLCEIHDMSTEAAERELTEQLGVESELLRRNVAAMTAEITEITRIQDNIRARGGAHANGHAHGDDNRGKKKKRKSILRVAPGGRFHRESLALSDLQRSLLRGSPSDYDHDHDHDEKENKEEATDCRSSLVR